MTQFERFLPQTVPWQNPPLGLGCSRLADLPALAFSLTPHRPPYLKDSGAKNAN